MRAIDKVNPGIWRRFGLCGEIAVKEELERPLKTRVRRRHHYFRDFRQPSNPVSRSDLSNREKVNPNL